MIGRCHNPNWNNYFCKKYYKDKGIQVCDLWRNDFNSFLTWSLQNGYRDGYSIDRINSSSNYTPTNCRWIPLNLNKSLANKGVAKNFYVIDGKTYTTDELCIKYSISRSRLRYRLNHGMNLKAALGIPDKEYYTTMTINERIRYLRKELLNINQATFAQKIKLKQNTVSFIEKEGSTVTEQNIEFICKEFHVNYDWLISGKGEPFCEDAPEDEYVRATTEIDIKDPRARRAIIDYWHLTNEDKELYWNFINRFVKKEQED